MPVREDPREKAAAGHSSQKIVADILTQHTTADTANQKPGAEDLNPQKASAQFADKKPGTEDLNPQEATAETMQRTAAGHSTEVAAAAVNCTQENAAAQHRIPKKMIAAAECRIQKIETEDPNCEEAAAFRQHKFVTAPVIPDPARTAAAAQSMSHELPAAPGEGGSGLCLYSAQSLAATPKM